MPFQVVNSAQMMCTMGSAPATLVILPLNKVMCGNQPAANIMDYKPMVNITTFAMCKSPANPAVATATAAAFGALTPMPCIPATAAPWAPGAPTVMIANMPALDSVSKCMCSYAGVISITNPGEQTTEIP